MSQDLAAILTAAPAKSAAPAKAAGGALDPTDALIRTVYGEAPPDATREERQAIASVIVNRARKQDAEKWLDAIPGVVTAPNQFEPWNNSKARKRIEALAPESPEYQAIAADVSEIVSGAANPYPGLTHFYAPKAQEALGRSKPSFDDGTGQQIGAHLFFGEGGDQFAQALGVQDAGDAAEDKAAFAAAFGDPKKWDEAVSATGAGLVPFKGAPGTINEKQQSTYEVFEKGGFIKPKEPEGSVTNPLWLRPGGDATEKDVPPGIYFVDLDGKLKRAPGAEDEDGSMFAGASRGLGDVMLSMGQMMPGTDDSVLRNRFEADQMAYDADFKGDPKMGAARFAGQVVGTLPLLAGGEAALGAKALGGVGKFLAGRGTLTAAPKAAQLGYRGASLATSGAAEGAASAALVSSASEPPIEEQMLTGALLGGLVKPGAKGVETGVRRLFGPSGKLAAGAAPLDEQMLRITNAKGLPVEVPMTQGQISGAPGQQLAENAMLKGVEGDAAAGVMQKFVGDQQQALRANVDAIGTQIAGGTPRAVGESGKIASARLNAMKDAFKATVDANYKAAREVGADAMLATAKDLREGALATLRESYDLADIEPVVRKLEAFGEGGSPTVREVFELRSKISSLTQSADRVTGGAAKRALGSIDDYMRVALKNDLILGDPTAVDAWRKAIKSRADFGKLFEGNDLIESLTERASRGGERDALVVAPEDAANYIFNRSSLGMVGKKDLKRDLVRLKTVLGPESEAWNAIRGEAFKRLARAGEGAAEAGQPQFSGQKFFNAWTKAKADDDELFTGLFTGEERALIDRFAEVSQRATTAVKGGDNPSNSGLVMKKFVEKWFPFLSSGGGAAAGAAMAGPPGAAGGALIGTFFDALRETLNVRKAVKATRAAPIDDARLKNKLIPDVLPAAAAISASSIQGQQPIAPGKQ